MADRTIDGIMNSFQSGGEVKKRWGVDTPFEATPRKYDPSAPSSLDPENVRWWAEFHPGVAIGSGLEKLSQLSEEDWDNREWIEGGLLIAGSIIPANKVAQLFGPLVSGGRKMVGKIVNGKYLDRNTYKKWVGILDEADLNLRLDKIELDKQASLLKREGVKPAKVLPNMQKTGVNWVRDADGNLIPDQSGISYSEGSQVKRHIDEGTFFDDVGVEESIMAQEISQMTSNQLLSAAKSGFPIQAELRDQAINAAKHVFRHDSRRMKHFMELIDENPFSVGRNMPVNAYKVAKEEALKSARIRFSTDPKRMQQAIDLIEGQGFKAGAMDVGTPAYDEGMAAIKELRRIAGPDKTVDDITDLLHRIDNPIK